MASYVGLDLSQQATQICILEATGAVRWTGKARSLGRGAAAARARARPDGARERRSIWLAVRRPGL